MKKRVDNDDGFTGVEPEVPSKHQLGIIIKSIIKGDRRVELKQTPIR